MRYKGKIEKLDQIIVSDPIYGKDVDCRYERTNINGHNWNVNIEINDFSEKIDNIQLNGIEFLVLSIFSLLIQYIPKLLQIDENTYMLAGTYIFLIYYGIKNIIIYTCERKKELDNLSDIKEIVKDEPIKKETKRKNKTEE